MDKKCSQLIIGQSIIHSFNPKPFKNMDTAIYALNNKELKAGEIAIAYYNDPTETRGIGAIVATGNILPGGNQIFKNTAYTDKLIKNIKELIESNSVDISVIEENLNNNIADIAVLKTQLKKLTSDANNNNSSVDDKLKEINELINNMKNDVSNIIDNINKIVADASKSIVDTATSVSKDYLAADTSLKNYVDAENIKINQKIDNISSNFDEKINEISSKINSNTSLKIL